MSRADKLIKFGHCKLIDRKVQNCRLVCFSNDSPEIKNGQISSNGSLNIEKNFVTIIFDKQKDSYFFNFKIDGPFKSNGISASFKIGGWIDIKYVALGYVCGSSFRHVKIKNPLHNSWIDFSVGHNDILWMIQNNWHRYNPSEINDIKIFIKAGQNQNKPRLKVREISCWLEDDFDSFSSDGWEYDKKKCNKVTDTIYNYYSRYFVNPQEQADKFKASGECPLTGGVMLPWSYQNRLPDNLLSNNTYRFSWHALHPAAILMLQAHRTKELSLLFAAAEFVSKWLDQSFFDVDEDQKFAWYDHGTAERLISLLLLWVYGNDLKFDNRFMRRLQTAIFRHAQLLASEAFYASNQNTRYHNHAWFQDLALIITALIIDKFHCSDYWLEIAVNRLSDQFDNLIVRENGYAVFIENSIGYHIGAQGLISVVEELLSGSDIATDIHDVANEMRRFTKTFCYPDGRRPSHGDTFRRPNFKEGKIKRGKPYANPGCIILPKAGYAVVKGNHDNLPFMLCMFSTSLCKTHKHEDNLSFTFFFDGVEWFIDPSFYSHEYASPITSYLRSAWAHNNVVIKGIEYSVEPNISSITGIVKDDKFELKGNHEAYSNLETERSISGRLSQLSLVGRDLITQKYQKDYSCDAYLIFHLGEGVSAKFLRNKVLLSHVDTKHKIILQCELNEPLIYQGWDEKTEFRSISGVGFMRSNETVSLFFPIRFNNLFEWKLMVVT